jgi:integrase
MAIKEYLDKDGQTQYEVYVIVRCGDNGKLQKRKSKIKTRKEAERLEKSMLTDLHRQSAVKETLGHNWGFLVERWSEALTTGPRTNKEIGRTTLEDYIGTLRFYTKEWFAAPATSITTHDVKKVVEVMTERALSNARKRALLHAINGLFLWAKDNRIMKQESVSPAIGVKISRKEDKKPDILNKDEIRTFLDVAKKMNHDWYYIWALATMTGMRSGELYALEWKDIDWEHNLITCTKSYNRREKRIKETKAGYWRDVPINRELKGMLQELRGSSHLRKRGAEFVLPRFRAWDKGESARVLRTFLVGIGMRGVKFHALRACFATQLLRNGIPAAMVMKICGWTELKTMQYYVRLAGIEISGATDNISFLTPEETMGKVVGLFQGLMHDVLLLYYEGW